MKVRDLIAQLEQCDAPDAEAIVLVQWKHGTAGGYSRLPIGRVDDAGADGFEPSGRLVVIQGSKVVRLLFPTD